jgi:hypothetical protein
MKTPAFQARVAERMRRHAEHDAVSIGGLSVQVIKATLGSGYAPLIELRASADSPGQAERFARSSVDTLSETHAEIAKPLIGRLQEALAESEGKLANAEREAQGAEKMRNALSLKGEPLIGLALSIARDQRAEASVAAQRLVTLSIKGALDAPASQPTKVIEEIFVSGVPVSPKKNLLIALGMIGGLLAGMVAVFGMDAWRRARGRERGELAA